MRKPVNPRIANAEIKAGMVVKVYGDTERVEVARVKIDGYGSVQLMNMVGKWYGISDQGSSELTGRFNP